MLRFIKNLMGGVRQADKKDQPRSLTHPKDLQPGDILKFGFAAQAGLSGQSFTVTAVDTLDLGGESHMKTLFTLQGVDNLLRLAVVKDRQGERLEVGRSVLPDEVKQVFSMDAFIDLLDPDTGVNHVLERIGEPAELAGWTAPVYRQEAGHNAYFHTGDYRARALPVSADEGQACSYYLLVSDDRQYALEVQVYDGGRTEVYLLVYLPLNKIEELWPAGR